MNLFYCSYPYGTASASIFTGTFPWNKQWLSHTRQGKGSTHRERRWEIEKVRGRKKKRTHHKIPCTEHKEFKQQGAKGLEKELAAWLIREDMILRKQWEAKADLSPNTGEHSRRWSATEVAGMLAVSALRITGLFSDAFRKRKRTKRAHKIQSCRFKKT